MPKVRHCRRRLNQRARPPMCRAGGFFIFIFCSHTGRNNLNNNRVIQIGGGGGENVLSNIISLHIDTMTSRRFFIVFVLPVFSFSNPTTIALNIARRKTKLCWVMLYLRPSCVLVYNTNCRIENQIIVRVSYCRHYPNANHNRMKL